VSGAFRAPLQQIKFKTMQKNPLNTIALSCMLPNTTCTTTQKPNSVEIYNQIETKFSWIRTLYRGTDDENTRLIAYLANEQKLELAIYL
jgi:hypothetical protein